MSVYALENGFESGVDEAEVLSTHAGDPDAWSIATENTTTGGVLRYDSARARAGSLSARIATGATAVGAFVGWNLATATPKAGVWLYLTAYPASLIYPIQFLAAGATVGRVGIDTAGKVRVMKDASSATLATSAAAVPLNTWFLLSADFTYHASAGVAGAYVYTTGSTPTTQAVATAQAFAAAAIEQVRFGVPIAAANVGPLWIDDVAADTAQRITPVQAAAPVTGTAHVSMPLPAVSFTGSVTTAPVVPAPPDGPTSPVGVLRFYKRVGGVRRRLGVGTLGDGSATRPGPMRNVVATSLGDGAVELTFQPPTDTGGAPLTGFHVGRDGYDAAGTGPQTVLVDPTATSHQFFDLVLASRYTLSVAAVTERGSGPVSYAPVLA